MKTYKVFEPGSRVDVGEGDTVNISGTIKAVQVGPNDHIDYYVIWFSDGRKFDEWFPEWLVSCEDT